MTIQERIAEYNEDALTLDGFDFAIVGMVQRCGMDPVVCYDYNRIIEVLMMEGMTEEDAIDYYGYNILGAYVGENTPMILNMF